MDRDKFWTFHTDEGRKAFLAGASKEECPFVGRAGLAWTNGWSIEFGQTSAAKANEKKAKKAVESLVKARAADEASDA